jgi:Methane oxygenase PmoA
MVIRLDTTRTGSVSVTADSTELFRYVYEPTDAQLESPRPYFHPVRTLAGDAVTLYRPHDHVWHKGIAWSLPNAGPANFWGGTTYLRGQGYRQLANNGRMRHEAFRRASVTGGVAHLDEDLTWVTEQGQEWLTERRRIGAAVRASTLLMRDRPGNLSYPCQWFVRSTPFACLCPAPFFSEEHPLPAGERLALSYAVAVADGALTAAECGELATMMDRALLAVPRSAAHAGSTP